MIIEIAMQFMLIMISAGQLYLITINLTAFHTAEITVTTAMSRINLHVLSVSLCELVM